MENKSFGSALAELRKNHGMTQLELADKLGVTDKAVSKWERDIAMPEVENLIKISDMFGVSLDTLLRGEEFTAKAVETVEKPQTVHVENSFPPRKIVGTILVCFGAVVLLFLTLFGDLLSGLIFSSPFFLCGAICLIFKKRIALFCAWALYFSVYTYLGYATGMNLGSVFQLTWILLTRLEGVAVQVIMTWSFLVIFVLLTLWTAISFRKKPVSFKKALIFLLSSVAVYAIISILSAELSRAFAENQMSPQSEFRYLVRVLWSLKDFVKISAVATFVTSLVNLISNMKRKS